MGEKWSLSEFLVHFLGYKSGDDDHMYLFILFYTLISKLFKVLTFYSCLPAGAHTFI